VTLRIFDDVDQRSERWYELRCGMVTASVVGTLLTPKLEVADNETSRRLTAQLVAERITGRVEPTFTSDDMFRGIEAEGPARDMYSEHFQPATECGFMVREESDWRLGFSPDGLVGDDGLIEVKAPRPKGHLRTILTNEVPRDHMAQIQAGLLVSGRKWLDFISVCADMAFYVRRVLPDPDWQEAIVAAVQQFEENAEAMTARYVQATEGLLITERFDLEMVV
jgi:hypothetical protein